MLVVAGTAQILPDHLEEAKALAAIVVAETEKEAGCISYRFYQDISIPTTFHVFEEWESEEHLNAHLQTEHVKAFGAALRPFRVSADIKRYYIESVKPL